jgi:hypothetical protein
MVRLEPFARLVALMLLLGITPADAAEPRSLAFSDTVSAAPGEALPGLPWGASRKQIEKLRGTRLEVADPYFLDHYGPPGVPRRELLELEEKGIHVGGFGGIISYRLRQGGLYQVLVWVEASLELAARYEEILKALESSLGAGKPSPKERGDELHAREWALPGRKVRYWMLDDPSAGPQKRVSVAVETTQVSP